MYHIRKVDGQDEDISDILSELHQATFFDSAPLPDFASGIWWLASEQSAPVAFAGLLPSTLAENAGYFCRVGVLRPHRGNALQRRLMRAVEVQARTNGWCAVVSDTTDNIPSANNFIKAGYRLYEPRYPWGWPQTLYWRKLLDQQGRA